jgi:hypothetical protein
MRRPLSSTRVEAVPSPRSEMPAAPAAKPLPKLVGTEPWLSTARVCSSSVTVLLPERSMSARLTVSTDEAVSASARRMLLPVTMTRWTGRSAASWAAACGCTSSCASKIGPMAPPPANRRRSDRDNRVSVMSGLQGL